MTINDRLSARTDVTPAIPRLVSLEFPQMTMRQTVRVIGQERGFVRVCALERRGCGACVTTNAERRGCGMAVLSTWLTPETEAMRIETRRHHSTGDVVVIETDDSAVLFATAVLYLGPVLVLVAAAAVSTTLNLAEVWVAGVALAAGGTALLAVNACFKNERFLARFAPRIVDGD